jgi:hypothetical protein
VPDMWLRITHPDFLVYLQVSYANTLRRRKLNWTEAEYQEQLYRLRHAREHADLIVETDALTEEQVVRCVIEAIQTQGLYLQSLTK